MCIGKVALKSSPTVVKIDSSLIADYCIFIIPVLFLSNSFLTRTMARLPIKVPKGRGGRARLQANDEELQSLASEVLGGDPQQSTAAASSTSTVWKVVSLVLFAALIIVLSTSIEFKVIQGGEQDMDGHMGHTTVKPGHEMKDYSTEDKGIPPTLALPDDGNPPVATEANENPPVDGGGDAPAPQPDTPVETNPEPAPVEIPPPPVEAPVVPETPQAGESPRITYVPRGQPLSDADRQAMIDKWGSWTLVDDKPRPTTDIYAKYPFRDIPRAEFPPNAWQIDEEYLGKFLPEAIALVQRAQDGILEEYGKVEGTWEERAEMFRLHKFEGQLTGVNWGENDCGDKGGWTSQRSWEGLKRRLLHAIMTEDAFVFAMGGHSAAAGHGNSFQQSYTLQVQWILEAVFSRLGVRHQARNFGNGGLGTIQHGLATSGVFGPDVDFLMWDSQMTEKEGQALDVFARQGALGGAKVPVVWGIFNDISAFLHDQADMDVGVQGSAMYGIPLQESVEQIEKLPWAAQYVSCSGEMWGICRENEYTGVCWVDRDDFTPPAAQLGMGGRAKWHPGNRRHQVTGRTLTFTILSALKEALIMWKESSGYVLSDDVWHVKAYYENIRSKIQALPDDAGWCHAYDALDLSFVCKYPMQARTEFTPRAFPSFASIRSMMPPEQAADIGESERPVYNPPDVFNPALHPPPGAIDVLNIVENGVPFKSVLNPDYTHFYPKPKFASPPKVPIGKGITLNALAGDEYCDGSVDSWCSRSASSNCLLYAHNDNRAGLLIDGYSGWVVMNIPNLKNGFVAIKVETWHWPNENAKTDGWESINNEGRRNMRSTLGNSTVTRNLKQPPPEFCEEFHFEYAIDGQITSLNLEEYQTRIMQVQRVVQTLTLMKDPNYTGGVEKEVEVAFRITGCARVINWQLSHVYYS